MVDSLMDISVSREQEPATSLGSAIEGFPKRDAAAVLSFLRDSRESVHLRGVQETALGYLIGKGLSAVRKPMLLIAPTDREAEQYSETAAFFLGRESQRPDAPVARKIWYFPSRTAHKAQSL